MARLGGEREDVRQTRFLPLSGEHRTCPSPIRWTDAIRPIPPLLCRRRRGERAAARIRAPIQSYLKRHRPRSAFFRFYPSPAVALSTPFGAGTKDLPQPRVGFLASVSITSVRPFKGQPTGAGSGGGSEHGLNLSDTSMPLRTSPDALDELESSGKKRRRPPTGLPSQNSS